MCFLSLLHLEVAPQPSSGQWDIDKSLLRNFWVSFQLTDKDSQSWATSFSFLSAFDVDVMPIVWRPSCNHKVKGVKMNCLYAKDAGVERKHMGPWCYCWETSQLLKSKPLYVCPVNWIVCPFHLKAFLTKMPIFFLNLCRQYCFLFFFVSFFFFKIWG